MKFVKKDNIVEVTLEEILELVTDFAARKSVELPKDFSLKITTTKKVWHFDHENALIKLSNVNEIKL